MKALFLGLGSIGLRHSKILHSIAPELQIHAFRTHLGQRQTSLDWISELTSLEDALKLSPDIVFITNPSHLHIQSALIFAGHSHSFFIEKPIDVSSGNLTLLRKTLAQHKTPTYIAYHLRFHPVIQWLASNIVSSNVMKVSVRNLSYFPDWRPGTDHLKSYSSFDKSSGGILLDLSHEFDYIEYLFGRIAHISGLHGKRSDVTVDSDDYAELDIATDNVDEIRLQLNMACTGKPVREIRMELKDGQTLIADLINNCIRRSKGDLSFPCILDDIFSSQLKYFLSNTSNPQIMNNLDDASALFLNILRFKEGSTNANPCDNCGASRF